MTTDREKGLRDYLSHLRRKHRPPRYQVEGDDDGGGWLADLAARVRKENKDGKLKPHDLLEQDYWLSMLAGGERKSVKDANQSLRNMARTKDVPDGFLDEYGKEPISIVHREPDLESGKMRSRWERVQLEYATPHDLRGFSAEELRRAANDFTARKDTCAGADWLADQVELAEAANVLEWIKGRGREGPGLAAVS